MTAPGRLPVQEPWTSPSANTGPQAAVPVPADAVWVSAKQYCQRLGGLSYTTLQRMIDRDPDFPRATYFGQRRYFKLADIKAYERACEIRTAVKKATASATADTDND